MTSADTWIFATFAVYLVGMLAIGAFFFKRTHNLSDYILGSRRLGTWVTSLSAQASDMSGWLLLGLPGFAYLAGLEAVWIAVGLAFGTYLNWTFVATRLRRYTEVAGNALTLPDYFENRFRDDSRVLRVVAAVFILIFFMIYTSAGFVAGAKLFNSVFHIPYTWALLAGAAVIIAYTFLGGFMAVCWTDLFQGMLMFGAILTVPVLATTAAGGFDEAVRAANTQDSHFLSLFMTKGGRLLSSVQIVSLLAWGLGYFGQPHILARFMAVQEPSHIRPARNIAMVWVLGCLTGAVLVGITAHAVLPAALGADASETVFMAVVQQLVPPMFAGVLLAGVLAAVMSTADSQLLVTSSTLTEDLYRAFFRRDARDMELVWIGRSAVVVVAAAAAWMALDPGSSVLALVAYAWGGFGAAFGPLILISLYWKRMTRNGAVTGVIVGGLTVIVWRQISGGIFELYELVPGFVLSALSIVLVSLLDSPPTDEVTQEFTRATASAEAAVHTPFVHAE
jgi:sodium/proline symporter